MHTASQCPPDTHANSVELKKLCLYLKKEPRPYCGDGEVNQDWEGCDDENNESGDGCSSECLIEECGECAEDSNCSVDYYSDRYCEGDDVYRDLYDFFVKTHVVIMK